MEKEFDLLGFDPTQLSVFNQDENKNNNANTDIYHTRPADSVSEDGRYRATIKVIYSPFDLKHSVLEQQSYSMHDAEGWFSVVSSLTNNDTSCPVFKAWKTCRYSPEGSVLNKQSTPKEKGGNGLFDKRFARYVTIQVISDKNRPELEGRYMLWKMPKSIWDIINAKMNPAKESGKAAIPVMDFLFGRAIDLEVIPGPDDPKAPERKTRETKYMGEITEEVVTCMNPDKSSLLDAQEQTVLDTYVNAMSKVWRSKDVETRNELIKQINADPNTQQLQKIYRDVLSKIKTFCPDLNKELGYNEWDDATKKRVQNWIDIVLQGNDPAAVNNAPASIDSVGNVQVQTSTTPSENTSDPFAPEALNTDNDDEELPF